MAKVLCRECRDGKHVNCDGSALDFKTDQIVPCECIHTAYSGMSIGVSNG